MEKQVQIHEDEQKHVQLHVTDEHEQQHQHVLDEDEDEQLKHANPIPSPNIHSPPPEPHQSPKSQSPPLYFLPQPEQQQQELQNADDKQPPFEPLTPPAVVTAPQVDEERGPGRTGRRQLKPSLSILKRSKRESMLKRALLVFRLCGFVFSLVSFSVLAADKDRGWAIDSFYRYKEFRYLLAVNVIAFSYSGFQAFDLIYQLTTRKHQAKNHLRCYMDFSMDQILTYLLMSASSSAAVRIDDWQSNWGKDEFPDMAKASVGLSFLAFLSLGLSSLISGYALCSLKSM